MNDDSWVEELAAEWKAKGVYDYVTPTLRTSTPPEDALVMRRLSTVVPKPIEWLWQKRLARGKLTMFFGSPGAGKSQVTCYVASVVSNGGAFFTGEKTSKGSVLFVTAEDDASDTLVPRLLALGANMEKIIELQWIQKRDGKISMFNFELHMDNLRNMIEEIDDLTLLIVDPISAFMGKLDSNSNSEVRGMIKEITNLAEVKKFAVIFVHHFNKNQGQNALARVSGSTAFGAAARMNYVFGSVPPNDYEEPVEGLFAMAAEKNNLAMRPSTETYRIVSATIGSESGPISTSRVDWEGEVEWGSQDIADYEPGKKKRGRPPETKNKVVEMLREALDGTDIVSPDRLKTLRRDLALEGVSENTFRAARRALDITVKNDDRANVGGYYLERNALAKELDLL